MRILPQHLQIDDFIGKWLAEYRSSGKSIYCGKNCAGCCNLAVHATFPEAVQVAKIITKEQARRLTHYVDRLGEALTGLSDLKGYLKTHRKELGPCPFLDNQDACSIYPTRPISCRALLSTRPAEWCTVDFAELDEWDRRVYEGGLDRQIVAWPTHYVAATQDFGRRLENELLESMRREHGWSLTGNFSLLVWLASQCQEESAAFTLSHLQQLLSRNGLGSELVVSFVVNEPEKDLKRKDV